MNTPAIVAVLMLALPCAVAAVFGAAVDATGLAVGCSLGVVFLIALALTFTIPLAVDEALAQQEERR